VLPSKGHVAEQLSAAEGSTALRIGFRVFPSRAGAFVARASCPPSISLPTPKVEHSFHARVIAPCKSSSNPPKTMAASVLGKRQRQLTIAEGTSGNWHSIHGNSLIIHLQTQFHHFAAGNDARSTQHQKSTMTAMDPLKRRHPKMRVLPWIWTACSPTIQAPPA
jgi:hypothetical protein